MSDPFPTDSTPPLNLSLEMIALRLGLATLLGGVVGFIYLFSQRKPRSEALPLLATLVLLTILIAMVSQVIGNSIARAFSLVGALAIVRFRTVVEDTRDTAFVIFAVVVGMAVGTDVDKVAYVGIPIVGAAALALNWWGGNGPSQGREATLTLRLGLGHDPQRLITEVFPRFLDRYRLLTTSTARQGAALDLVFSIRLRQENDMLGLVNDVQKFEGVQSVEVRSLV